MVSGRIHSGEARPIGTPQSVTSAFTAAIADLNGVQARSARGYPAALCHGTMFAAVFRRSVVARLSPDDRKRALDVPGARVFQPSPGHHVIEFIEFPRAIAADPSLIRPWVERAYSYVTSCLSTHERTMK